MRQTTAKIAKWVSSYQKTIFIVIRRHGRQKISDLSYFNKEVFPATI